MVHSFRWDCFVKAAWLTQLICDHKFYNAAAVYRPFIRVSINLPPLKHTYLQALYRTTAPVNSKLKITPNKNIILLH